MPDYSLILSINFSGNQWSICENDYATLIWLDETPKPTQSELDDLWESTKIKVAEQKAQKESIKTSALAKLAKLGLTEDEVKALLG